MPSPKASKMSFIELIVAGVSPQGSRMLDVKGILWGGREGLLQCFLD